MIAFVAFSLKRAWQGFWRNAVMSLAATATMVLMLVLLSGLLIGLTGLDASLKFVEQKVNVIAYIQDAAPSPQVQVVQTQLEAMPQVTKVSYVSKAQALANFKARSAEVAGLADYLPSNPLPASFEINLRDPENYIDVVNYLNGRSDVIQSPVHDQRSTVEGIITIANVLRTGGIVVLALVGFTVLFIIVNTIRLAVVARAEEIEIMRLVGASDAFIRWPFIFEGALVGLLGAAITLGLLAVVSRPLSEFMNGFFNVLPLQMNAVLGQQLAAIVVAVGMGIGVLGSYVSVRSYLIR